MSAKPYDESWDRPHAPSAEPEWQESDWLIFYDARCGVGGIYRLGQEPNLQRGQPMLFVFASGEERYYQGDRLGRSIADVSIAPADRWSNGCQVLGHKVESLGDGQMRYSWEYPETSADLVFSDNFYNPRGWSNSNKDRKLMADFNKDGHLEVAGQLRGVVRIGQKHYDIDALAHRDRSWGNRPIASGLLTTARSLSLYATVGPEFSIAAFAHKRFGAAVNHVGFISRHGKDEDINCLDIFPVLDSDLNSPIGCKAVVTLESGEIIRLDCEVIQSYAGLAPGFTSHQLGAFTYEGKSGFCDFVLTANHSRGEHYLTSDEVTHPAVDIGLSRTADIAAIRAFRDGH